MIKLENVSANFPRNQNSALVCFNHRAFTTRNKAILGYCVEENRRNS